MNKTADRWLLLTRLLSSKQGFYPLTTNQQVATFTIVLGPLQHDHERRRRGEDLLVTGCEAAWRTLETGVGGEVTALPS